MFRNDQQRGAACAVLAKRGAGYETKALWQEDSRGVRRPTGMARAIADGATSHSDCERLLLRIAFDMWNDSVNRVAAREIAGGAQHEDDPPRSARDAAARAYNMAARFGEALRVFDRENLRMVGELLVALAAPDDGELVNEIDRWIERWAPADADPAFVPAGASPEERDAAWAAMRAKRGRS